MGFEQKFPRSGDAVDLTRVIIVAEELGQQNLNPREPNHIQKDGRLYDWSFIGFTDIQESISHTWEPYGAIQGRLSEVFSQTEGMGTQVFDALVSAKEGVSKASLTAALNVGSTAGAKYKVDTPLVYTGSERRKISFTFTLMEWEDVYMDVLEPIHQFRKLSCAGLEGKAVDIIDFPAIFSVKTSPQSFVDIKDCALTDVQVTWNSPYKGGNPTRAELTVTFLDLRPLYKSSWGDSTGAITTSVEGAKNRRLDRVKGNR